MWQCVQSQDGSGIGPTGTHAQRFHKMEEVYELLALGRVAILNRRQKQKQKNKTVSHSCHLILFLSPYPRQQGVEEKSPKHPAISLGHMRSPHLPLDQQWWTGPIIRVLFGRKRDRRRRATNQHQPQHCVDCGLQRSRAVSASSHSTCGDSRGSTECLTLCRGS